MHDQKERSGMRVFFLIWAGQLVSILGTNLSGYALGVWLYQQTGAVTNYGLSLLFQTLPALLLSSVAGVLVDKQDRRKVMIFSDLAAGLGTLTIALLLFAGRLEVWHIYLFNAYSSILSTFQRPAYTASITLLVPKEQFGRASGMVQMGEAIGQVIGPALAGILLVAIGLPGLIFIDVFTAIFAVTTLLFVAIPHPPASETGEEAGVSFVEQVTFGWRYIMARSGLLGLLVVYAIVNFALGGFSALLMPFLLSLVGPQKVGLIVSASSVGLLLGGMVMSAWGGPQRKRVHYVLGFLLLLGLILASIGLTTTPLVITALLFTMMLCVPVIQACSQPIWQSKVPADVQGRVFAARSVIAMAAMPLAYVTAGPLVDQLFNPLLVPGGALAGTFLGRLIGVGSDRGIGLMFLVVGVLCFLGVISGYLNPHVRNVEEELPDAA